MTRYAIDAATLLRLVADDATIESSHRLVAPSTIRAHAMDRLLGAVIAGDLTEAVAVERLERMTAIKIRVLGDRVSRRTAWAFAREHGWSTTADADYIAVCRLQADALVALDPAMVALADGLVPLAPYEALFVAG